MKHISRLILLVVLLISTNVQARTEAEVRCTPSSRPKLALHKLSYTPWIPPFSETLPLVSESPAPDATAHDCRT